MMKNKLLLIPIGLGGLGLLLILMGSLTSLETITALAISGAIVAIAIVVILFWKKKPPAPATTPPTSGSTPTTTATPVATPTTVKPVAKADNSLGWAIFGVFLLIFIMALLLYGSYSVAKFVWTKTQPDSHLVQSIPTVRVTSPLLVGHGWKEPAPKKKVRTEKELSFTMVPGQVYTVSKMEMHQGFRLERADGEFQIRVRRTEMTAWQTLKSTDKGRAWKADWGGTMELRTARPNTVTVVIVSDQ